MATARPPTEATRTAEHAFYEVVDAQRDDLQYLRERWPDRTSPEALAALARLLRRAAPDGEAETAMEGVFSAYGGAAVVPPAVRRRLAHYVHEHLERRPWPERDLAEDLGEPALLRKRRRQRREAQG
jgi:regulator of protease activity HflC (stomatin/prohibitin superfamily)